MLPLWSMGHFLDFNIYHCSRIMNYFGTNVRSFVFFMLFMNFDALFHMEKFVVEMKTWFKNKITIDEVCEISHYRF